MKRLTPYMLAVFALLVVSTSAAGAPVLGPIQHLSGPKATAIWGRVAMDGEMALVVWSQSEAKKPILYRRYSEDGGDSWSAIERVFPAGEQVFASAVVVDRKIHLVFAARSGNDIEYQLATSADGGKTFGTPVPIGKGGPWRFFVAGNCPTCAVATLPIPRVVAYGRSVWVAYIDAKNDAYVRRSKDGGKTFDAAVPVEASASVDTLFLALANDGSNIYVATEADNFGYGIYLYRSRTGGASFLGAQQLGLTKGRFIALPDITAFGFRVAVAWRYQSSKQLLVAVSIDRGDSFRKPVKVASDSRGGYALAAAKGRIDLLYSREATVTRPADLALASLANRRETFGPPLTVARVEVDTLPGPSIAAGAFTALYSWSERRGNRFQVLARVGEYIQ